MNIESIARVVRLPPRKVRYVIDQQLLPGARGAPQADVRGKPRSFTELEAFFVAGAALLLEGGIKRGTVIAILKRLAVMPWPLTPGPLPLSSMQRGAAQPRTGMEAAFSWAREPTALHIGDGVNLRLVSGKVDTGWVEPRTWAPLRPDYVPQVSITVDFAQLRARFTAAAAW